MRPNVAAYRSSASRRGVPGFQGAAPARNRPQRGASPYRAPGRPANDNVPPPRKPANDNIPGGGSPGPNPRPLPAKGSLGGLTAKGRAILGRAASRALGGPLREVFDPAWPTTYPLNDPQGNFTRQPGMEALPAVTAGIRGNYCTWSGVWNPPDLLDGPAGSLSPSCVTLQSWGSGPKPSISGWPGEQHTIPAGWNSWIYGYQYSSLLRYRTSLHYWRNGLVGEFTQTFVNLDTLYATVETQPYWVVDPFSLPIIEPAPAPLPDAPPYRLLPERRPNPRRAPGEQPVRGPAPSPLPAWPALRPSQVPVWRTEVTVGPRGVSKPSQGPAGHDRRPPGRGEREKKIRLGGRVGAVVLGALSVITEGMDLVNAIWWAIDPKVRPRGFRNPAQKAGDILLYAAYIDPEQMATNIILMELQDRAIGKAAKARRAAWSDAGIDFGSSYGTWLSRGIDNL